MCLPLKKKQKTVIVSLVVGPRGSLRPRSGRALSPSRARGAARPGRCALHAGYMNAQLPATYTRTSMQALALTAFMGIAIGELGDAP